MKTFLTSILAVSAFVTTAHARFPNMDGSIMLGGGYLEEPDKAYGFGQIRGTFYEDDASAHTLFLEFLGHGDDVVLEYELPGIGTFLENGDITFANITANYELELKLSPALSFYLGGGAGVEIVSIDDSFDISLDTDNSFVAQAFAGLRANFQNGFMAQVGARYLMREDFSLLGDQFVTEDSWAYEASFGFRF